MQVNIVFTIAVALFGWSVAGAEEGCRARFDRSIGQYTRVVDSLRLDKPGQAHVYTPNGLEFTPAEALWLQRQLREVVTSCTAANSSDALQRLQEVRRLIDSRTRHQP